MKTFVVLAVSVGLVVFCFCPVVMSAPSIPDDIQIVQPDPSLPRELAAFVGKWAGTDRYNVDIEVVVYRIAETKAKIAVWSLLFGWTNGEGDVFKEHNRYTIRWMVPGIGKHEFYLKGRTMIFVNPIDPPATLWRQ